jgi:hypothetical protein
MAVAMPLAFVNLEANNNTVETVETVAWRARSALCANLGSANSKTRLLPEAARPAPAVDQPIQAALAGRAAERLKLVVEVLEPEVEVLEPEAEVLEPEAEVLAPEAEVLEPEAEVLEPAVEALEPAVEALEPAVEVLEPAAAQQTVHCHALAAVRTMYA